ncbi:hypothetical protein [Intrasporangium sp.]|uniref:hypothetical protein n=1 Tax=Intrasporangium sp. TaxID=1925024 RepID=UPI00293996F9|nr:hypothetical protein [Intrasporangium sp.]MDV3220752.1 hypothetical protein [Intrasporangium sp.]
MDRPPSGDAEILQRALDREPVSKPGILELVSVLHAVAAVDQSGLAPRREFVTGLREQLTSESHPIAQGNAAEGSNKAADGTTMVAAPVSGSDQDGASVSVLHLAARPVRYLAAAAAAIVLLAGGLGVASRQAAPGDLLYPVKQLLDRAAVQLAGGGLDVGLTHLAQAQEHLSDARELVDRGDPAAADLVVALDGATGSTAAARSILIDVYRTEGRADALTALADFITQARPQVDALRPGLPGEAVPSWERLRALLAESELETLRELASCTTCGERAADAQRQLDQLLIDGVLASPVAATDPLPTATGTAPAATAPTGTTTAPDSTSTPGLPGATVSLPPATIGSATVGLPGVGITTTAVTGGGGGVTLPDATVNLPTLGVSSTVTVGGGGVTLPGATLTVPTLSVPLDPTLP